VSETIEQIHEAAMAVAKVGWCECRVGDPGNVHEPGDLREYRLFSRHVMMERVVQQREGAGGVNGADGLDRLGFEAQRAGLEAERFDEAGNACFLQKRTEFLQRDAQLRLTLSIRTSAAVVRRHENEGPGTT